MAAPLRPASLQLLDAVQHLAELERFEASRFLGALDAECAAGARAELDGLRFALTEVDAFTSKAMRIRLVESLGGTSLTRELRTYITSMVTSYVDDLALLRRRVAAGLARVDARTATEVAEAVEEAAARVLAVRAALRAGIFETARALATRLVSEHAAAAADRRHPDAARRAHRLAERDLAVVVAQPTRIEEGTCDERERALPEVVEEMPAEPPSGSRFAKLDVD